MVLIKRDYTEEEKENRKEKAILELQNWEKHKLCLNCQSSLIINIDSFININNYPNMGEDINQYEYKCPYCGITFCLFESAIFNDDLNQEKREYLDKLIKNKEKLNKIDKNNYAIILNLLNNNSSSKTPIEISKTKKYRKPLK